MMVQVIHEVTRKKLYKQVDKYLNKLIVSTTKLVVKLALQDCKVEDIQFKLLVMPSLELLGPKLVSVDPFEVVREDVMEKYHKYNDKLDTTLTFVEVFIKDAEDLLASFGPREKRFAMYKRRCKALLNMRRTKMTEL